MEFVIADIVYSIVGFVILFLRYWSYKKMKNHLILNDFNSFSEFTKYQIVYSGEIDPLFW